MILGSRQHPQPSADPRPPNMKSTIPAILALAAAAQATVQGFDISHYQPTVNYAGAYASGARFVIIKVSHTATSTKLRSNTLTYCRQPKAQHTPTRPSQPTTTAPPTPASSAAATTSPTPARPPAPRRRTTSSPTGAAGPATA